MPAVPVVRSLVSGCSSEWKDEMSYTSSDKDDLPGEIGDVCVGIELHALWVDRKTCHGDDLVKQKAGADSVYDLVFRSEVPRDSYT